MASTTSTAAHALPSAEAALFDRSERLWGAESQKRLRAGRVIVLGATPAACEALKNIVLPGLGSFVVVDSKLVDKHDLGSNFFLEASDEGKPRAAAAAAVLAELNPLCVGTADTRSITEYVGALAASTESLDGTVVVASSDVSRADLISTSEAVSRLSGCMVHVVANGLLGIVRLQANGYFILATVPGLDTRVVDLRPLNPFPELQEFIDRYNPEDASIEPEVHAHIPWFVVLHHAVRKWKASAGSGAERPRTAAEWKVVKAIIDDPSFSRGKLRESFTEAQTWCSARVNLAQRNIPELMAVLNDARAISPTKDADPHWFLAHGLKRFREAHGNENPVIPKIPDFDATTQMFKELQGIFKRKGAADAAELWQYAQDASNKVGGPAISQELAAEFSAQAWEINFADFPKISVELNGPASPELFSGSDADDFKLYVAHRAALLFKEAHGRYPGFSSTPQGVAADTAGDIDALTAIVTSSLWPTAPVTELRPLLGEWVRGGGCEIVTTSSVLGAVAGQECIKLIQRMRRPVVNTLVYNGVMSHFTTISGPKAH